MIPLMMMFCNRPVCGRRVLSYSCRARCKRSTVETGPGSAKTFLMARYNAKASSIAREPPAAKAPPCVCAASPTKVARDPKTQVASGSPAALGKALNAGVASIRALTTGFQAYKISQFGCFFFFFFFFFFLNIPCIYFSQFGCSHHYSIPGS